MRKITKPKPAYVVSKNCLICQAQDSNMQPMRDVVDAKYVAGDSLIEISDWCKQHKLYVSSRQVENHLKSHSLFIYQTKIQVSQKQKVIAQNITAQKREADSALDRIINIGDKMVENWEREQFDGEQVEGPKMPVTEKLYVEALREQGRRGSLTKLDDMFEQMEQQAIKHATSKAIDGEIVKEEKNDRTKSLPR